MPSAGSRDVQGFGRVTVRQSVLFAPGYWGIAACRVLRRYKLLGNSILTQASLATENGAGAGRTWKLGGMMGMFTFLRQPGSSFDVKQLVEIRVSSVANAYYVSSRTTLGEKAGSDSCSKSHRTEPA